MMCARLVQGAGVGGTRRWGTQSTGQVCQSPLGGRQLFQCQRTSEQGWKRGHSSESEGREQQWQLGYGTNTDIVS